MSPLRASAFAIARAYAAKRGLPIRLAFDDSLPGDLARLHLLRRLRIAFPVTPIRAVDALIKEVFTP
jgi:hypothetical protein